MKNPMFAGNSADQGILTAADNIAVKRRACANGYIFWQPRANFPRKTLRKQPCHTQNLRDKIETVIEICKRKRK